MGLLLETRGRTSVPSVRVASFLGNDLDHERRYQDGIGVSHQRGKVPLYRFGPCLRDSAELHQARGVRRDEGSRPLPRKVLRRHGEDERADFPDLKPSGGHERQE